MTALRESSRLRQVNYLVMAVCLVNTSQTPDSHLVTTVWRGSTRQRLGNHLILAWTVLLALFLDQDEVFAPIAWLVQNGLLLGLLLAIALQVILVRVAISLALLAQATLLLHSQAKKDAGNVSTNLLHGMSKLHVDAFRITGLAVMTQRR